MSDSDDDWTHKELTPEELANARAQAGRFSDAQRRALRWVYLALLILGAIVVLLATR